MSRNRSIAVVALGAALGISMLTGCQKEIKVTSSDQSPSSSTTGGTQSGDTSGNSGGGSDSTGSGGGSGNGSSGNGSNGNSSSGGSGNGSGSGSGSGNTGKYQNNGGQTGGSGTGAPSGTGTGTTGKDYGGVGTTGIRFKTPQAAILYLVRARGRGDRTDALRAANETSVSYVFAHPGDGTVRSEPSCERTPAGAYAYHCFIYYEGGGQNYDVNFSGERGFKVVRVEYVAD
jgi:hypothetical protein